MWKSAIFLAILGLLTTSLKPVFPKSRYHNYQETTVYVSETTRKEIEEELYAFFNTSSSDDALSISEQKASLSVRKDLSARINSLSRMETAIGCVFDVVDMLPFIDSIRRIDENSYSVVTYLTTAIKYHYPEIDYSDDHMLIGVTHEMELVHTGTAWKIVKDSFDERSVTGIASQDVIERELIEAPIDSSQSEKVNNEETYEPLRSYSVLNVISYAMTYCGFNATARRNFARTGTGAYSGYNLPYVAHGTNYYNQSFYHSEWGSKDCANYVSQCLNYGGLPQVTGGPHKWFYLSSTNHSVSWKGAYELMEYLIAVGYGTYVNLDNVTNINAVLFPGNPVFWDVGNNYHAAICTGYNTAGQPVICAHTNDVYRLPFSALNSTYIPHDSVGTVQIVLSNHHSSHSPISDPWYYDDTKHFHVCQYCEYPCNVTSHSLNYVGYCSVCGYLEP